MRIFSSIMAAVVGTFAALILMMYALGSQYKKPEGLLIMLAFLILTGAVLLVFMGVTLLLLAAGVRVFRGAEHVGWVRPGECIGWTYWLLDEWRFFGKEDPQEGVRFFGLEIAFVGSRE